MKAIYLLSGLGADERVFHYLDLSPYEVHYIRWITPLKEEKMAAYARRLCDQIHSPRPVLLGVSFGGMMAIEIAKQLDVEKVVQVSSVKLRSELPLLYRIIGQLKLNRLVPGFLLKKVNPLLYWFFGTTSDEDKILLKAIVESTDTVFLKWAIDQIVNWKNEAMLNNLYQIQGTSDRLLPHRSPDFSISGGGHLMVVNRAGEIDVAIATALMAVD